MPKGYPGSLTHGILSTYHRGCRCAPCVTVHRAYKRGYYKKNPTAWRRYEIQRKYGISLEEYDELLAAQDGRCGICNRPVVKHFDVDHCHKSLRVRGLLCRNCNRNLGWYEALAVEVKGYLAPFRSKG